MFVGSDPEVFLKDSNGNLVSSIGKIGGTKKKPRVIESGWVQEDNVLLEFNSPPAADVQTFVENHIKLLKEINTITQPLDLSVSIQATGHFDPSQLTHPKARKAGCEPDFNAWGMCMNVPPNLGETTLRSGAGHLHISHEIFGPERSMAEALKRAEVVRVMDVILGIPSVLMDSDKLRRDLYGKAGCHRSKFTSVKDSYNGLEYRTLSNFWLRSEDLMAWAFNGVKTGFERREEITSLLESGALNGAEVQRIINDSDTFAAEAMVKRLNLMVA